MSGFPTLQEPARELYLELLAAGGAVDPDAGFEPADLQELAEAGLVLELWDGGWVVADPRHAWTRLRSRLRSEAAALLSRAEAVVPALAELSLAYDRAPVALPERSAITRLDANHAINQRIRKLAAECRIEALSVQPGGARPPGALKHALQDATELRGRGVAMRTIYQPGARTDAATAAYAAAATALGARLRVLDEDVQRMLIIDRRVAVVGRPDGAKASFVEDPALVEIAVNTFERDWERSERVRWESPVEEGDGPLIGLLAQGLTQGAVAKRLGLSERTVAARIAALRERYDAQSLFQLGWQLSAAGEA